MSMSYTTDNSGVENEAQQEKKPDFISFNKSPCLNFTPPHYSSPLKTEYYKKNKWKDNRKFNYSSNTSGSYSENSYNDSRRRYSPFQRCNESNNYGRNYCQNYSAQQYFSQGNNHSNKYSGNYSGNFSNNVYTTNECSSPRSGYMKHERDITCYLHPSFMEDPWKRLEEEYLQKNEKQ